jgi:hypothetical protein
LARAAAALETLAANVASGFPASADGVGLAVPDVVPALALLDAAPPAAADVAAPASVALEAGGPPAMLTEA